MPWLSATTVVDRGRAEPLSDALIEAGALSVDVSDAHAGSPAERAIFDEPDSVSEGWECARLSALFEIDADIAAAMTCAFERAGVETVTAYDVTRVEDEDWVRRTQSQFTPQHVSPRLWVVPTWHEAPDADALTVVLDPGLAFGTGTHPTTRLCLEWLDTELADGETVIDFGCGSGILAIAAMKLGAASAWGVDIDPQAVLTARRNAEQNGVEAHFVSAAEDVPAAAQVVVANILAQPLKVLAPLLAKLTRPGGKLALSGVLHEQAEEVQDAYAAWYDFSPARHENGWVLLRGVRR